MYCTIECVRGAVPDFTGSKVQASISFRPLERSDFPQLQEWLAAPYVAAWWNERNDLASVEAQYGPRIDGVEPTHVFVIERKCRPIGWIQWYLWSDYPEHARQFGAEPASAGIDLANRRLRSYSTGRGEAATAARFAGQWTEHRRSGAAPVAGLRIYEWESCRKLETWRGICAVPRTPTGT